MANVSANTITKPFGIKMCCRDDHAAYIQALRLDRTNASLEYQDTMKGAANALQVNGIHFDGKKSTFIETFKTNNSTDSIGFCMLGSSGSDTPNWC